MSGGKWNYQSWQIKDDADGFTHCACWRCNQVAELLKAAGETERLIDWAECGDSSPQTAQTEVYMLWLRTFDKLYG